MTRLMFMLALAVAIPACSEHQDITPPDGGGEVVEVRLVDFAFVPADTTVDVGTTIRWRNTTATFHTITPDGNSAWQEFQTNAQGQTFDVTFNTAGTYNYLCSPHESLGMTGRIRVQ